MRKLYLSMLLACCAVINTFAVEVTVIMNSISRTMTLSEKNEGGELISTGIPSGYNYTFDINPGTYILSGFDSDNNLNGTLEITVADDPHQEFKLTTVTSYAHNSGWEVDVDYTLDCRANSREGEPRVITTGKRTVTKISTTEQTTAKTFLMYVGDSYSLLFTSNEAHIEEGYLQSFNHSSTVTATSINAYATIPTATKYTITIPQKATLFVGSKWGAIWPSSGGTHYVPFIEILPENTITENGKTTYEFSLGKGCVYNYRVSQPGKLTNGGIFQMTEKIAPMEITEEMLDLENPKYINHNVADNSGANVADILMNINEQGHLKMKSGETHQMVNLRSWQLTDNSTNNYFIEPDYHYNIIGLDGNLSDSIIEVDSKGLIKAKKSGTAIVQITYDAIYLQIYNTSSTETPTGYYYGPLWSAIWPENTGTFVVTVDDPENTGIVRNMNIQEDKREDDLSVAVDAEHDIFYYLKEEEGYTYTFKPEGVSSVSMANPTLEKNISKYTGFKNITANEDGSYTVLLTLGRNIIKMTSPSGVSDYQIITAKPVSYDILNGTNPGEPIQPGDEVNIQFSGFFHPANKLAGIYNMSTYIMYNGTPNGTALILGPNQYQFAGDPRAQVVKIKVPQDWETTKSFDLEKGALQINGFGSIVGKHRGISITTGINPNFTAVVRVQYYGAIPSVSIPINETKYYEVTFEDMPENSIAIVKDRDGNVVNPNENNQYILPYGPYKYTVKSPGYKMYRSEFKISSESPEKQIIKPLLELIGENGWDGETFKEPAKVTEEEATIENGKFEGKEGFYKITSGYELAWFANEVNTSTADTKKNEYCAIIINNVDLCNFDWTRIGSNSTNYQYKGIFDGAKYTVEGLFIDTKSTYQGLFGYINGATVKNLTVKGSVKSTNNYIGGIIGYSNGTSVIDNCHNYVTVSAKQYTGGILGASGNAAIQISNCSNFADIIASSSNIGGIMGSLSTGTGAKMDRVVNTGNIYGVSSNSGGIIGAGGNITITNSYNTGNIEGTNNTGGITGNMNASGSIINAYNTGIITSSASILYKDGIKGGAYGTLENVYTSGDIYKNIETLKTEEEFAGGNVAWLLGEAFGQVIGKEIYPILGGKIVYQVKYLNNLNTDTNSIYTNGILPIIEKEGYKTTWYNLPYGNVISEITENTTIYLLYTAIDSEAPTTPNGIIPIPSETSIELSWEESTDNVGVTGYNIYVNDEFEGISQTTHYILRRLKPATKYNIGIEAFDKEGNKSEKATLSTKTTDETSPTQPMNLTALPTETTITLEWAESSDNVAVTGYNIYVNGELDGVISNHKIYTIKGLNPNTKYEIEVEAFDAAGNKSEKATTSATTLLSTSIDNPTFDNVKLYPNPVQNFLNIKTGEKKIEKVVITDVKGNYVYSGLKQDSEIQIPVAHWNKGIYMVIIQTGKSIQTYKIVKE